MLEKSEVVQGGKTVVRDVEIVVVEAVSSHLVLVMGERDGVREVGGRVKTGVHDGGDRWRCRDVSAFLEAWTQHVRKVR